MKSDQSYMARAMQLAERGRFSTQPNPRVACLIVKDNEIVGEGYHQQAGKPHAEINALTEAGDAARDADVFVTLEPCSHQGRTPPCVDALIAAHPKRVVIAVRDPNPKVAGNGIKKLQAAGIKTELGICESQAKRLNRGFIKRMLAGTPFVTLKLAASLDGRIAMQSGESAWITSSAARKEVHRMRLESCAVITGINTVLTDDSKYTVRLESHDIDASYHLTKRQPVRVVLDRQGRLTEKAAICQQAGEAWQIIGHGTEVTDNAAVDRIVTMPHKSEKLDLPALLAYLGRQEMNNVLIEAGGTLAASFIKAGLVDELVVFQSPDIMGSSAQAMINLPEIQKMTEKIQYEYCDMRKIGRDLKLVLSPTPIN